MAKLLSEYRKERIEVYNKLTGFLKKYPNKSNKCDCDTIDFEQKGLTALKDFHKAIEKLAKSVEFGYLSIGDMTLIEEITVVLAEQGIKQMIEVSVKVDKAFEKTKKFIEKRQKQNKYKTQKDRELDRKTLQSLKSNMKTKSQLDRDAKEIKYSQTQSNLSKVSCNRLLSQLKKDSQTLIKTFKSNKS